MCVGIRWSVVLILDGFAHNCQTGGGEGSVPQVIGVGWRLRAAELWIPHMSFILRWCPAGWLRPVLLTVVTGVNEGAEECGTSWSLCL